MAQIILDKVRKAFGPLTVVAEFSLTVGRPGVSHYAAAKAGIAGFTRTLAKEVGPQGITANAIAPGYVGTDMVMAIKPEVREGIIATIPMGRLGKPEEIGGLCAYLASDLAGYMTGATLNINGGLHFS